jgi:hypothetical protein
MQTQSSTILHTKLTNITTIDAYSTTKELKSICAEFRTAAAAVLHSASGSVT